MKEIKLYRCEVCGNLICMVEDSGVIPVCCGMEMDLVPMNIQDASREKHVPVIERTGDLVKVSIGSEPHPMISSHFIEWIVLLTTRGVYSRSLAAGELPEAEFSIREDENVIAAYANCNIHGLWRKDA